MMRLLILTLSVFFSLTLAACQGAGNAPDTAAAPANNESVAADSLIRQKFILTQVNGAAYTKDNAPFIEFGDGFLVFGKACNSFRGPGELTGGVLLMKNAVSTKMACIDGELAAVENLLLRMLSSGAELSMDGESFFLKQGGDALLFKAAAAPQN